MKVKAFAVDTDSNNKYCITFWRQDLIGPRIDGTYNTIAARLLGLSFPEFLRYCRDNCNGTIIGRTGYSYITFNSKKDCEKVVKQLNERWDFIMIEREKIGLNDTVSVPWEDNE